MHDATGFSTFHLTYGREVRVPLQLAKEQWEGSKQLLVSVEEYLHTCMTGYTVWLKAKAKEKYK